MFKLNLQFVIWLPVLLSLFFLAFSNVQARGCHLVSPRLDEHEGIVLKYHPSGALFGWEFYPVAERGRGGARWRLCNTGRLPI